ncbi:MAG: hypothetical protein WCF93_02210 [Candidatus Moraniibacteriota bacterium]
MDYDVTSLVEGVILSLTSFYHSPFFLVVKIVLGIYLVVILVDIVLLLILRDIAWDIKVGTRGTAMPVVSKRKMRKRWNNILGRLESGNTSQYKVAIIEADALVEEFLKGVGYRGENMTQKLEQVGQTHLDEHRETLIEVHKLRNRIVHEADFELDQETAKDAIKVYENFLKYLDFLS